MYAGAVYLRSTGAKGCNHVTLIISMTKVAPIRRISILRLELCGAVIAPEDVYMRIDDTIVLAWLSGNPRKLKTYEANRVTEITDDIPPSRWRHVRSEDNPAYCASRGLLPSQLMEHHLWWSQASVVESETEIITCVSALPSRSYS